MVDVNGFYDSAENVSSYFDQVDLFIAGVSGEERYARGFSVLNQKGLIPGKKILFYFNEVLANFTEADYDRDFALAANDYKLRLNLYDEMNGLFDFRRYMDSNPEEFQNKNIVVDFTVLVKPYFFLLMKHLLNIRPKRMALIYTEPDKYASLTRGAVANRDIPGYSGSQDLTKKDALAILLGFEGNRANSLYGEIQPDLTIPINGFPSFKPEFKDESILKNRELLTSEEIFKKMRFAPANDPFETKDVLNELYDALKADYNLTIAPLGSKPMALGSCFFALEHPECRVVYPYPQEYLPKASLGWNNSWLYITEIKDALAEGNQCAQV